jgi:hypothetical protein
MDPMFNGFLDSVLDCQPRFAGTESKYANGCQEHDPPFEHQQYRIGQIKFIYSIKGCSCEQC